MCKKRKGCGRNIDPCMREEIKSLNVFSKRCFPFSKTLACCCGHGKYPKTIIAWVGQGNVGRVVELFSGVEILRKSRFYKKDKQGYYYIPEVIKKVVQGEVSRPPRN